MVHILIGNNIHISQYSFHTFDLSRFCLDHPIARRVQVDPTTIPLRTQRLRRLAEHVAGVDAEDGSPTATGGKTWSFHGLLIGGYSSNSHNPILKWYPPN